MHIQTDMLGYIIGRFLSQITLNKHFSNPMTYKDSNFSKFEPSSYYLLVFFLQMIILTKTCYGFFDWELLAIIKVFMTWCNYLESCKYKVFVLTDHNNFHLFMDSKYLSFKQVCLLLKKYKYGCRRFIMLFEKKPSQANDS